MGSTVTGEAVFFLTLFSLLWFQLPRLQLKLWFVGLTYTFSHLEYFNRKNFELNIYEIQCVNSISSNQNSH